MTQCRRTWLSFGDARAFVHELELRSRAAWRSYCRGDLKATKGLKPKDIPSHPERAYRDQGWDGWPSWLGEAPAARADPRFLSFRRARTYARRLKLRNVRDWRALVGDLHGAGPLPANVPADPESAYPDQWAGWQNWLGLERGTKRGDSYRSFPEARAFVQMLGLRSTAEWWAWVLGERPDLPPVPDDLPHSPDAIYYADGWKGMGDFLGTGNLNPSEYAFRPFEAARRFARGLGLANQRQWFAFVAGKRIGGRDLGPLPYDLPTNPNKAYEGQGWLGWWDWLGTPRPPSYRPFEEAREFARALGLRDRREWHRYRRGELPEKGTLPEDVPPRPNNTYRQYGWRGYPDWLGTAGRKNGSRPGRPKQNSTKTADTSEPALSRKADPHG